MAEQRTLNAFRSGFESRAVLQNLLKGDDMIMRERLLIQLKFSCHRIITTAQDEYTGRVSELLAVQMTRATLDALISILEQCPSTPTAEGPR